MAVMSKVDNFMNSGTEDTTKVLNISPDADPPS
jgi:hypothetical protein